MNKKWIFHGITFVVFVIFIVFGLASTATTPPSRPSSATATGHRTIILNDENFSENEVGGFVSWFCYKYPDEKRLLLEVGTFGDPELRGLGYILYDGGHIGELTHYERIGIEHRWDWGGPEGTTYSFVIKPDGTGLYYNFSNANKGESIKARDVFKCYKK
jgi:hypothetical protein